MFDHQPPAANHGGSLWGIQERQRSERMDQADVGCVALYDKPPVSPQIFLFLVRRPR